MSDDLSAVELPAAFEEEYVVGRQLGKGHFSVVHEVERRSDRLLFAGKVIQKKKLSESELHEVEKEVGILKEVQGHEHVARYEEHFDTEHVLVIVMELVEGGELFAEIVKQKHYAEMDAATVAYNMLLALQYVHGRRIVHRDLKPENILLSMPLNDKHYNITDIKLTDFGFADRVTDAGLSKCCGTPLYIAPDVLNCGLFKVGDPYSVEADMWSLGVIMYILLCGYPPFRGRSTNEMFKAIVKGVYSFPTNKVWGQISDEAKDFISKLLVVDRDDRMTCEDALSHPWIADARREAEGGSVRGNEKHTHLGDTVANLVEFNAGQQWRKGIFGVELITRLRYATACKNLNIRPNSEVARIFSDATSTDMTVLDLSANYLGPKGLMALVPLIEEKQNLRSVVLKKNGVNNAVIELLCACLKKHKGIQSLDLSENPISHIAGRHLLNVVQINRNLHSVNLQGTALLTATVSKIEQQVARNHAEQKKQASAEEPV